jgi:hypothetical protein
MKVLKVHRTVFEDHIKMSSEGVFFTIYFGKVKPQLVKIRALILGKS